MRNFKDLWDVISLKENKVSVESYLEALNDLRENYGITAIDRRLYEKSGKFSLWRFQHKLRFMRKQKIVREIVDSTCPYCELFEIVPYEEWKIS
jgi:hypothetical protein